MPKVRKSKKSKRSSGKVPPALKSWLKATAEYRKSHPNMGRIPKRGSAAYNAIRRMM